jgi:CubicO group peptidase (beta-lactamase class C family)
MIDEALIAPAFAPAAEAVAAGRIPGAVLGVVTGGERAACFAGAAQIEPVREALSRETWFDLASLTKVIFTTTRILRLVDEGHFALDDPLAGVIPDLRQYDVANAPERRLTFRQCLAHRTHRPGVEPLYTYGQDPATLRAFILQRVWTSGPSVYSDINFMLLGIAIERVTGRPLIEQPLADGLTFRPDPARCAATERCTWRRRVIRGEVHDENAFALGGASGHAGLFGTIDGVLDFAQAVLDGRALSEQGLAAVRARESETRTVGWEAKHAGWSGGDMCSGSTIGHTGFTGTGLWIDFDRRLAWTLLTNRVHPTRHRDTGIVTLRRATGEQVIRAFGRGSDEAKPVDR